MAKMPNRPRPDPLRQRALEHFQILRVPIGEEILDQVLTRAEKDGLSHLAFLDILIGDQARLRRERSVERRIRQARFPERKTLEGFDWDFNQGHIDRVQMEELGTVDFVRRCDSLIFVGQSGVGKSHLIQAIGIRACAAGYSVRYTTSASLIDDLTGALADKTLTHAIKQYTRPNLLVIDEFGFDKIERSESPQAGSLLYKVIDARYHRGSTALVTNIDFDAWAGYLEDAPLSMALLDRLVESAIIVRFPKETKSWRKAQAEQRKRAATSARKKKATRAAKTNR